MKLVINIPCFNEEKTLPLVLKELPTLIPGIDEIEVQVVDDGSSDDTAKLARDYGCRVIQHRSNRGLGIAFKSGLEAALASHADLMVNTDGDNQYPGSSIPALVEALLNEQADVVIGNREPWNVSYFSPWKRVLQWLGNGIARRIAGVDVPDTVSGFRAYSQEAMLRLNVVTRFSYTLDTIVQVAKKGLRIRSVPIETNPPTRPSRLFRNMYQHMRISTGNILRIYTVYEPFRTFLALALLLFIPGASLSVRFLFFFLQGDGSGHVQSLIAAAVLIVSAVVLFSLGILGDLVAINRMMTEDQLYLAKKQHYGLK